MVLLVEFAFAVFVGNRLSYIFGADGSGLVLFPAFVLIMFCLLLILNIFFFQPKNKH
ncbi:hypothetical protein [Virgibacillus sp. L01]|uniref:hypothetical protein n=1 Tax=Virgibacillus sp. L01 TaxID=3457429 RepID=UPI003FD5FB42